MDEVIKDQTSEDQIVEDKDTGENQEKNKTFTQKDVDRIVKERLDRERASTKKTKEDFEAEKTNLENIVKGYEEVLKTMVDEQLKDIPEPYRKIVQKLSILEQLEFLKDPNNKVSKKVVPVTPKGTDNKEIQPQKKKKFL